MNFLTALLIVIAIFVLWYFFLFKKESLATPPYQNPVGGCNQDCNQGRDCVCFQESCDQTVAEYDKNREKVLASNATWPFPNGKKP
jgi:hypothetical protein